MTPSSDVSLQAREYERANTAVVNAYVATALSTYLEELLDSLPRAGLPHRSGSCNRAAVSRR